jgi:uncharacterized protein
MVSPDGEAGLNYLCAGYKHFFTHIGPQMRTMAQLVAAKRPAAEIMQLLGARDALCPCGSGMKYLRCCGRIQ